MRNKILHSVTNRTGGFKTPSLLTSTEFQPSVETVDSREVRRILGVDQTADDYHVLAMLAAVAAQPEVLRAFQDGVQSYRVQDFALVAPLVAGAVMVPDKDGAPTLAPVASTAPIPDHISIDFVSATAAAMTYGGRYELMPCYAVSGVLYPTWPVDLGITGGLQMPWSAGAHCDIYARPVLFPYQVMADTLQASSAKNIFLQSQGLLNNFYQAEDAQKKVALVALALGLSNSAVYG
jgi:hypothetical protein